MDYALALIDLLELLHVIRLGLLDQDDRLVLLVRCAAHLVVLLLALLRVQELLVLLLAVSALWDDVRRQLTVRELTFSGSRDILLLLVLEIMRGRKLALLKVLSHELGM